MAGSVGDGEFGFQIAPMLDILFVLLLFFMVSAGAQKHEGSIVTQLPGTGAQPGTTTPEKVGIDEDGQVNIYDVNVDTPTSRDMPQLIARLTAVIRQHPEQPIIVTPSRSTRQQRVVDVLNACEAAKVKNLAFGAPTD